MKWRHLINRQLYSECQLVAALNAYYVLTGCIHCHLGDPEYERLVDLIHARDGAAIQVVRAERDLQIRRAPHPAFTHWTDLRNLAHHPNLPLTMDVWHKRTGYHRALIVAYSKQCDAIRVANFPQATTDQGWMFLEDVPATLIPDTARRCPFAAYTLR
ncbi:MAG: hypothetical protein WC683_01995 [bacterium]